VHGASCQSPVIGSNGRGMKRHNAEFTGLRSFSRRSGGMGFGHIFMRHGNDVPRTYEVHHPCAIANLHLLT
jgi:hypothetical protein